MSRSPHFSPDGKFIYFIADDDGTQNLAASHATGGDITRPISGRVVSARLHRRQIRGVSRPQITTMDRPAEVLHHADAPAPRHRITHVNDAWMAKIQNCPSGIRQLQE